MLLIKSASNVSRFSLNRRARMTRALTSINVNKTCLLMTVLLGGFLLLRTLNLIRMGVMDE